LAAAAVLPYVGYAGYLGYRRCRACPGYRVTFSRPAPEAGRDAGLHSWTCFAGTALVLAWLDV